MVKPLRVSRWTDRLGRIVFVLLLASGSAVHAQLSSSAYRALGQTDLRQNGTNMVQGLELYSPSGVAVDTRGGQVHLYIADTHNSRILAWADIASYQIGDPPALVLGQPGPQYSSPLGIGAKGLNAPLGLAVDPINGNLYVADFGDNRVLRFPSPFANPSRIEPDAVYGQPSFTARTATPATSSSLSQPRVVALDSAGNLWVADTGNHRVVRFGAAVLNSPTPPAADIVIGQKDFFSGLANQGGAAISASGLDTPAGLAFDSQNNLYVSDFNNTRVLKYSAPLSPSSVNPPASAVFGEANLTSRGVPLQASSTTLAGPEGLAVDGGGNLYVAVPRDNRVLVFPLSTAPGAAANVLGQSDFSSTAANANVFPGSSPNSLSGPADVKVDQNGTVYVADSGNNRVLAFPRGSKSASSVWGQNDFVSNGANQTKPGSVNVPYKMAIDYSVAPYALYVSDTANHRVLAWKDSIHFRTGDPADLVIGQPSLRTAVANVDTQGKPSATSLSVPAGIAVNPNDGTLYVADSGNNRVLRYPRPTDQAGRITPDAVIGQADFTSSTSAAVSASSLNSPTNVAIGPNGDLFVSDSGNNRVLEFAAGAGTGASAIRVYGQPSMFSSLKPSQVSAQTLASPLGIFVDRASNLFIADTGANRVLVFPNTQNAPPAGTAASFVIGQAGFGTLNGGGVNLKAPYDVTVDSTGSIYVADSGNNRVLIFTPLVFLPIAGASATSVVGQPNVTGIAPNWDSPDGLATADSLFDPVGLYIDRQDTLYVGDAGNNRLLQFLKAASVVNSATFQSGVPVGQGSIATLFGSGLASGTATVSATVWPTTLMNRQVVFNDQIQAPIYYMAPGQSNFQVPSNAPVGTGRVA
ncbi:MAG TPA: hypothetical protein VGZ73_16175, partial [Bryobacteraceae bacterium]|nr:hypothetical protein [Bryobacteraceae bacterium]